MDPALQTLIEEHRQAIDLTYFDGLTSEECAAKLGVSLSLFNWWKKTALAQMRHVLSTPEAALA